MFVEGTSAIRLREVSAEKDCGTTLDVEDDRMMVDARASMLIPEGPSLP